jgi:hypothetical protein
MIKKSCDHLHHVHESYFEHMSFAVGFGLRMIAGGIGAVMHGLCPAIFQCTASTTVKSLHEKMTERLTAKSCADISPRDE